MYVHYFSKKIERKKENNNNACKMLSKIVHNSGHSIITMIFIIMDLLYHCNKTSVLGSDLYRHD